MPLPKLKYIVAPSVDFNTEEEDPSKFVLPMPQSIRVNLVCRGALLAGTLGKATTSRATTRTVIYEVEISRMRAVYVFLTSETQWSC